MTEMTPVPVSTLSKQRLRLWLRLLRASRGIEMRLREDLRARHDTTLPRFDVMAALDRHRDGLRMSDLSARLRVSNGNVTGIVERLVQDGLVERAGLEGDRRAFCVRLTEAGRARFAEMAADHEGWVDAMMAGLDGRDLEVLAALLARLEPAR
jgi:DNA-binding MarR family transcriptional regulator